MNVTDSEGLRLFRERCSSRFPESLVGRTWYQQRDWVMANVPQDSLVAIYIQLMADLRPISQAQDDTVEGRLGDEIRDVADIVWYALDQTSADRADSLVAAMDAVQPGEGAVGSIG